MIANEEIVIREISRLKLAPNEILVLRLPEDFDPPDAVVHNIKMSLKDSLSKVGIENECMVLIGGATLEVLAPQ